jgi:hypothetical protein
MDGLFWVFFFMKNPLHSLKSYFLGQNFTKILPVKEILVLGYKIHRNEPALTNAPLCMDCGGG